MSSSVVKSSDLPETASNKAIFFLGATGYIGGTVLEKLLTLPTPPKSIKLLIRDPKKAELLKQIPTNGTELTHVIGSLQDLKILEDESEKVDIVIGTADADDDDAMGAVIKGMKKRREKTGHRGLLIQTSGTGVLVDDAKGQYPGNKIYTDLNPTPATGNSPELLSIATLDPKAPHRSVDLAIEAADAEGSLKSYIILPSTIWGEAKNSFVDAGFSNSFSQQIPSLIRAGLDRGQAGMIGKGANIWPHVEINDVGDLFALVYAGALRTGIGHGKAGYYFGISGEYTYLAATQAIGATLVENGWAKDAQPTTFTNEEIEKYYGGSKYLGSNSRGVADRSKSIGWRPKYDELDDLVAHIKKEVVRIEKTKGKKWEGEEGKY